MLGVPIYTPLFIYGVNMSVTYNTQRPESTLREKSNSVFYHVMRESVVMGYSMTTHIPKNYNPSDLMTKVIVVQERQNYTGNILYYIYDEHHYD